MLEENKLRISIEKFVQTNLIFTPEGWRGFCNVGNESGWQIKKFSYAVKQICSILTGIPIEDFEKEEVKNSYLGKEWDYITMSDGWIPSYYNPDNNGCDEPAEPIVNKLTVRELLQKVGTDAMRDVIHKDVWINALFSEYKPQSKESYEKLQYRMNQVAGVILPDYLKVYPNWIISDVRFPNEVRAIRDRGGVIIRVNRNSLTGFKHDNHLQVLNTLHKSETILDDCKFDYTIENNGTIEELILKAEEMLIKFKLYEEN
jgi:hypothetical protein